MEQTFDPSAFDRLAAAEPGHFWFEERRTLLLWALRHYFPAARNFCEVGCGTGFFLAGLAQCRPELRLTGVDYYSEALAHARHRLPGVTLELGDILKADRSGSFDVVGCFDVLEHIPDDINALAALATRLRPGGGLLLTVPQHPSLWSVADEIGHHQRRYRREELVRKVHTAGFQVLRVTSFVSVLLPLLWINRKRAASRDDALKELTVAPVLNAILRILLKLERGLIRAGISLPAGGSLLVVARKLV